MRMRNISSFSLHQKVNYGSIFQEKWMEVPSTAINSLIEYLYMHTYMHTLHMSRKFQIQCFKKWEMWWGYIYFLYFRAWKLEAGDDSNINWLYGCYSTCKCMSACLALFLTPWFYLIVSIYVVRVFNNLPIIYWLIFQFIIHINAILRTYWYACICLLIYVYVYIYKYMYIFII